MNKTIIIAIIAAALTGCTTTSNTSTDQASWSAFCKAYGYNVNDRDNAQAVDTYLDCWRGSAAEETALANND